MGFLDNSGDIILDAVLTDTGRARLAKGDGSFKIASFALGDDEINYALFNKSDSRGSAYYDLEIKQTPVLEAFTNNASFLKSKLLSVSRNDLLYLPVLKLNEVFNGNATARSTYGVYGFMVDQTTEDTTSVNSIVGTLRAYRPQQDGRYIRIDQGIDNSTIPATVALPPSLTETQYSITIDNRFGSIVNKDGTKKANLSFIDDDGMATYYVSLRTDSDFVEENKDSNTNSTTQAIAGSRGTILSFKVLASPDVRDSNDLVQRVGSRTSPGASLWAISTYIRVSGLTTGYTLDVPVWFMKVIA